MPFATKGRISRDPIQGGIEINEQQYRDALDGMMAGKSVTIDGGFRVDFPAEPEPEPEPVPTLDEAKAERRAAMETARKQAEAEGVTINGIRYAGDPSNRQALTEALELADDTGQTTFAIWKDSDDTFHTAHPVADVRDAYRAIGQRRGELIEQEGARVVAINAAETVADVEAVTWAG